MAMPTDVGAQQERRAAIESIIADEAISSQRELLVCLRHRGFAVTQPSVSRDLKEMGVARVAGRYRAVAEAGEGTTAAGLLAVATFIGEVAPAGPYLLVVRTPPGLAPSVALALDQAGWQDVVGTVAGDDTFFVAVEGRRHRERVEARLSATRAEAQHG
jgi:transcriptional regulator of arginine metabolism